MLFIDPLAIRLAYFIKKKKLNISPNRITSMRLGLLSPLIILLLFLAPILHFRVFYLFVAILFYFVMLTDTLDGDLARGLNKTSYLGAFLDSIADRFAIIIFFTLLFSIGLWTNNLILLLGSIFLFVLKTFHMMLITKLFYYRMIEDVAAPFSGAPAFKTLGLIKLFSLINKIKLPLKIKRWNGCYVGSYERYILTIILPSLLITFNCEFIAILLGYFFIIFYSLFFILRIKSLLVKYLFRGGANEN